MKPRAKPSTSPVALNASKNGRQQSSAAQRHASLDGLLAEPVGDERQQRRREVAAHVVDGQGLGEHVVDRPQRRLLVTREDRRAGARRRGLHEGMLGGRAHDATAAEDAASRSIGMMSRAKSCWVLRACQRSVPP